MRVPGVCPAFVHAREVWCCCCARWLVVRDSDRGSKVRGRIIVVVVVDVVVVVSFAVFVSPDGADPITGRQR